MSLADTPRTDMKELLPWAEDSIPTAADLEVEEEEKEGMPGPDRIAPHLDTDKLFPNCLYVPGVLHIVHNISKSLAEQLQQFDFFKQRLKSLCMLLGNRPCRERFVSTCLLNTAGQCYRSCADNFHFDVTEWRWANVIDAIDGVLAVWAMLVFWDKDKYLAGSGGEDHRGKNRMEVDVVAVTEAIQDPTFKVYAEMLRLVEDILIAIQRWGESCSCHRHHCATGSTRAMRNACLAKQFPTSSSASVCPMAARRAPELAGGMLEVFLSEWHGFAVAEVLMIVQPLPNQAAREGMLREWQQAREIISYNLTAKLAFFRTLPYSLASLGLPEAEARCHLRACREEFRRSCQKDHHRITWNFFMEPPLAAEVEAFLDQASPLEDLPHLQLQRGLFKLIPTAERSIERIHAVANKGLDRAKNISPAYLSFNVLRADECKAKLAQNKKYYRVLAEHFSGLTSADHAVRKLRIKLHPALTENDAAFDSRGRLSHRLVTSAIYHCDLEMQFQELMELRASIKQCRENRQKARQKSMQQLLLSNAGVPEQLGHLIRCKEAVRALQDFCQASAGPVLYSSKVTRHTQLQSLSKRLASGTPAANQAADFAEGGVIGLLPDTAEEVQEMDLDNDPPLAWSEGDTIVFTIVAPNPAHLVRVQTPTAGRALCLRHCHLSAGCLLHGAIGSRGLHSSCQPRSKPLLVARGR